MLYNKVITLNETVIPREKFTYSNVGERTIHRTRRIRNRLYKNPSTDDFQQEIRDRLVIETYNNNRYPISGKVSMYVEIRTSRELILFGVWKNIMDAFSGVIYEDDSAVESALVKRYNHDCQVDNIKIWVLSGKSISDNGLNKSDLETYSILAIEISTIAEDSYMPYPPNNDCGDVINPNNDSKLKSLLIEKCNAVGVCGKATALSITVDMDDRKVDIDNVALSYIVNLQDIAYRDMNDIISLQVLKKQSRHSDADKVEIRLNE